MHGTLEKVLFNQFEKSKSDDAVAALRPQIGKVVSTEDPLKRGRAKIALLSTTPDSPQEISWCSVVGLGAAHESGWQFPMQKGDHVLLMPYGHQLVVVGAIWQGEELHDAHPDAIDKAVSITAKDGDLSIVMDDDEKCVTFTVGDMLLRVSDDGIEVKSSNISIGTESGSVGIHAGDELKVEGENVTLQGQNIRLHAVTSVKIENVASPSVAMQNGPPPPAPAAKAKQAGGTVDKDPKPGTSTSS